MGVEYKELIEILNLLKEQRGFDFSGYRVSMLERRIQKRIFACQSLNIKDYYHYLNDYPDELDNLVDVLTINVSRFFRDQLAFEYLQKKTIPELLANKLKTHETDIRIWSAGCSFGEEAYTIAIAMDEILQNEESRFNLNIFGTDIDQKALKRAAEGRYNIESLKETKFGIVNKYFIRDDSQHFKIIPEIKKRVQLSFYDLLDEKRIVPPDSIFGGFDLILCRNVLIYFELAHQSIIFNKLYKSLKPNGYLMLGESEMPIEGFKHKFRQENKCCKIFKKSE